MLGTDVRQCEMRHLVHKNPIIEELCRRDVAANGDTDERSMSRESGAVAHSAAAGG
jgi:Zn-finger protein